jgi:hypothetical protein
VLIAGNGHVRADRGVPLALAGAAANMASIDARTPRSAVRLLTVALVEVRREWRAPAAYAAAFSASALPFDYVWFTPRASDVDHCAELRAKRK